MTPRHNLWVDGVNSAVMAKLVLDQIPQADVLHCDLGASVHEDSRRFIDDLESWYGREIIRLKSDKFDTIDDVFESRRYLSGVGGAPCTGEMKFAPRMNYERPSDIHYWGYTADKADAKRFKNMQENYPLLNQKSPLIDIGMTKKETHAFLAEAGIRRPYVYEIGMPNGNCLCCVKATIPNYWALMRLHFPLVFARRAAQSRRWGARLTRIKNVRIFIDEIPADWPTTIKASEEFAGCGFHCSSQSNIWYDL